MELRQGTDFDLAILGVPLGALPLIDSPLTTPSRADADPRWAAMIDGIAVTQTMSFQLWLNVPSSLLAEPRGLLTCYAEPEPSYGDFTPLITYEAQRLDWPHIIADVQPSNLYVLSQPKATGPRLGPAESGVGGLLLCGDWTRTDMNCGCEAPITGSRRALHVGQAALLATGRRPGASVAVARLGPAAVVLVLRRALGGGRSRPAAPLLLDLGVGALL